MDKHQGKEALKKIKEGMSVLDALISEVEEQTVNKLKVDTRGRIISVPDDWNGTYYVVCAGGLIQEIICDTDKAGSRCILQGYIESGDAFICGEATQAEVTRRKCIQRLRGMDGYCEYRSANKREQLSLYIDGYAVAHFKTYGTLTDAQDSLTEQERQAFQYRYEGE